MRFIACGGISVLVELASIIHGFLRMEDIMFKYQSDY